MANTKDYNKSYYERNKAKINEQRKKQRNEPEAKARIAEYRRKWREKKRLAEQATKETS